MAADLLFLQRVRQTGNAVLRDRPVSATQRQRRPVSSSLVLQGKVQQRQRPAIADNAGLETVKRPRGHWISWPVKGSIWRRRLPGERPQRGNAVMSTGNVHLMSCHTAKTWLQVMRSFGMSAMPEKLTGSGGKGWSRHFAPRLQ